jgi:hypothetical protein
MHDDMCHGYMGDENNYTTKKAMITTHPLILQKFKHPTKALCMYAMKINIKNFELVKHIASKLSVNYLEPILSNSNMINLIKINGFFLKYFPPEYQTEDICIQAIKRCDYNNLKDLVPYIKIWTDTILIELYNKNRLILSSLDYEFTF